MAGRAILSRVPIPRPSAPAHLAPCCRLLSSELGQLRHVPARRRIASQGGAYDEIAGERAETYVGLRTSCVAAGERCLAKRRHPERREARNLALRRRYAYSRPDGLELRRLAHQSMLAARQVAADARASSLAIRINSYLAVDRYHARISRARARPPTARSRICAGRLPPFPM